MLKHVKTSPVLCILVAEATGESKKEEVNRDLQLAVDILNQLKVASQELSTFQEYSIYFNSISCLIMIFINVYDMQLSNLNLRLIFQFCDALVL